MADKLKTPEERLLEILHSNETETTGPLRIEDILPPEDIIEKVDRAFSLPANLIRLGIGSAAGRESQPKGQRLVRLWVCLKNSAQCL
jgi:hypothetical protein